MTQERLRLSQTVINPRDDIVFDSLEKSEAAKFLKDTIYIERELETAKIDLSLKPDFNLLDSFRLLDPCQKGFVTP
jgi:Ca2+-binding EF-hand superfamily protein